MNTDFDAISSGKPIITNMDGWIGNIIENYEIGFSLEPDDDALLGGTKKLINMDENKISEMEMNARKLAIKSLIVKIWY